MTLPTPENWNQATPGLHQGARLLSALQQLTQAPQPAYLELGLKMDPRGVATGRLPSGGRALLDFTSAALVYEYPGQEPIAYPLNGCPQAKVFDGLFHDLAAKELRETLPPGQDLFERVADAIAGKQGRYRRPARETLMGETPIEIDLPAAQSYLRALQEIYTGIARFKAGLLGLQTPLIVWPHGFDLSTLWFAGSEVDESRFHVNFGFSPRSAGLDFPYLYAYAYPYPDNHPPARLPEGASWHTQGWQGIVLPYQRIAAQPDAVEFIEVSCQEIYEEFLSVAGKGN